jgi:hypothetical protein
MTLRFKDIMTLTKMYVVSKSNEKIPFDETFQKWAKKLDEQIGSFRSDTIKRCIRFCKFYDQDQFRVVEESIKTTDINYYFPKWCIELLEIDPDEIFELMKLADLLHIDVLVTIICIKISLLIKGKSLEEISYVFSTLSQEEIEEFVHKCN